MSILASHSIQNGTRHATTSKQQGVQFPGDFLSQYLPGGSLQKCSFVFYITTEKVSSASRQFRIQQCYLQHNKNHLNGR